MALEPSPRFPLTFKCTENGHTRTWTWNVCNVFWASIDAIEARCLRALRQGSFGPLADWTVGNEPRKPNPLFAAEVFEVIRPDTDGWYLVAPGEWRSARWTP